MKHGRRKRILVIAKLPPDALPLREVVVLLAIQSRKLSALDDEIVSHLRTIEDRLRHHRSDSYPVEVPFPPWGTLGWSARYGCRLVVRDEETSVTLLKMPRQCRSDACHVLGRLVDRLGLRVEGSHP